MQLCVPPPASDSMAGSWHLLLIPARRLRRLPAQAAGQAAAGSVLMPCQPEVCTSRPMVQTKPTSSRGTATTALFFIGGAVAQQQGLEPVARVALLAHRVITSTHQIAHGLVGGAGHAHDGKIIGACQSRQLHRVTPVGLDALARGAGNRRRGDHVAAPAESREVAAAAQNRTDRPRRRCATDAPR